MTDRTRSLGDMAERPASAIGVDVGGSGIKAAVVDVETGRAPVGAPPRPDPARRRRRSGSARRSAGSSGGSPRSADLRTSARSASACRASRWTGG